MMKYNKSQHLCGMLLVVGAFALPMFSALAMYALSLCALCYLVTEWAQLKSNVQESRLLQCCLVLFVVIALSAVYGVGTSKMATKAVVSYREFALIPLTIGVLSMVPQYRKHAINALTLSLSIVVLLSCLDAYIPLPFSKATEQGTPNDHVIFAHHINQNVMSSFLVLLALVKLADKRIYGVWRLCYALLAIVAVIDVLFLVKGRTGILTLLWGVLVFAFYTLSRKQIALAVVAAVLGVTALLRFDTPLSQLAHRTVYEVQAYQERGEDTSAGLRLAFWQDTWGKIKRNPVVGYGAGSYQAMYDLDVKNPDKPGYWAGKFHPHNELMYIWFQAGIVAALLYLTFLGLLFKQAIQTKQTRLKIVRVSVVGMLLIYSALDVPMLNHIEGMFFWLVISMFFTRRAAV
ncbi:MAG: O-antigen ligase family protein [Formosimonas sp.]